MGKVTALGILSLRNRNLMRYIYQVGGLDNRSLEPWLAAKIRDVNLEIISIEAVYNNFGAKLGECMQIFSSATY